MMILTALCLGLGCDNTVKDGDSGADTDTDTDTDTDVDSSLCSEDCMFSSDGACDDGGSESAFSLCDLGTDCTDCGVRIDGDRDGSDAALDCDDSDADISPMDTCDGSDNDCDGIIDGLTDTLEPNDASHVYFLGELDEEGDTLSIDTYMTHDSDQDAFSWYLHDHTDFFEDDDDFICVITPPADVDIVLELSFEGSVLGVVDSAGLGGEERFKYSSTMVLDDEGTYTLLVDLYSGASCDAPVNISCIKGAF
jgi:hypothetical protein